MYQQVCVARSSRLEGKRGVTRMSNHVAITRVVCNKPQPIQEPPVSFARLRKRESRIHGFVLVKNKDFEPVRLLSQVCTDHTFNYNVRKDKNCCTFHPLRFRMRPTTPMLLILTTFAIRNVFCHCSNFRENLSVH